MRLDNRNVPNEPVTASELNVPHYIVIHWWIVGVTLMVAFSFLLQKFGRWWESMNRLFARQ